MTEMLTLPATGLIQGDGTTSLTHTPYAFDDYLYRTENFRHIEAHVWRRRIANPIIEHLLLPRITTDVTVRYPQRNTASLITITHVNGQSIDDIGVHEARRVLAAYAVTVSYASAKALWSWRASLVHKGIAESTVTLALGLGLSPDEIETRHANGTLDLDALRTLQALTI